MIFLVVIPALEVSVNSTLLQSNGCKMTEKGPKTSIKCKDTP